MDHELILVNFRMRKDMKETFELLCRNRNIAMTSQLNMLVEKLIRQDMMRVYLESKMEPEDEPLSFLSSNSLDNIFG